MSREREFPTTPDGEIDLDRLKAELDAKVIAEKGQDWFDQYGEAAWRAALVGFGIESPQDQNGED
jgi:hypothetical protein